MTSLSVFSMNNSSCARWSVEADQYYHHTSLPIEGVLLKRLIKTVESIGRWRLLFLAVVEEGVQNVPEFSSNYTLQQEKRKTSRVDSQSSSGLNGKGCEIGYIMMGNWNEIKLQRSNVPQSPLWCFRYRVDHLDFDRWIYSLCFVLNFELLHHNVSIE